MYIICYTLKATGGERRKRTDAKPAWIGGKSARIEGCRKQIENESAPIESRRRRISFQSAQSETCREQIEN